MESCISRRQSLGFQKRGQPLDLSCPRTANRGSHRLEPRGVAFASEIEVTLPLFGLEVIAQSGVYFTTTKPTCITIYRSYLAPPRWAATLSSSARLLSPLRLNLHGQNQQPTAQTVFSDLSWAAVCMPGHPPPGPSLDLPRRHSTVPLCPLATPVATRVLAVL